MGNTSYTFEKSALDDYKYNHSDSDTNTKHYTLETETSNTTFNSNYYSDETIDSIIHDIRLDSTFLDNPKNSKNYIDCSNNSECKLNLNNYNSILYRNNLKNDPNLNLDKYIDLKYLEKEENNTGLLAKKYYILLYVWFIIMIILLVVFTITLFSNNDKINPIINYIVGLFILYCIYQIYKNIYN
jgi:hypothetical protein